MADSSSLVHSGTTSRDRVPISRDRYQDQELMCLETQPLPLDLPTCTSVKKSGFLARHQTHGHQHKPELWELEESLLSPPASRVPSTVDSEACHRALDHYHYMGTVLNKCIALVSTPLSCLPVL